MNKHTKGPWKITRDTGSPCSIEAEGSDGYALAKVYLTDPKTRKRTEEYAANAALIAAAPELLEALESVLDVITGDQAAELGVYDAIRKARGGAQ